MATVATLITSAVFQMNIRNFNISNTVLVILDEQQLYLMLTKTIGDQGKSCEKNLKASAISKPASRPSNGYIGMYGQHFAKGVGILEEVHLFDQTTGNQKSTTPVFKVGPFMQHLNIVKMDFASPEPIDPSHANFPTALNTEVRRDFTVYYKFVKGSKKTRSGGICTITDTSGCEKIKCTFSNYELAGTDVASGKCQATCVKPDSLTGGGSGSVDCYKVDETGKTFVGCDSAKEVAGKDTTGTGNAFFGYEAGNANTTGSNNTLIGYETGQQNTKGKYNVFIGYKTGKYSKEVTAYTDYRQEASKNTYIGSYAGEQNAIGRNHVFIGYQAGKGNKKSGQSSIGGQSNTFIGSDSGIASRGDENVFIGAQTGLQSVPNSEKTANSNVFIGAYAGSHNTGGDGNVFIGRDAGQQNTTGNANVAIGYQAGKITTNAEGSVLIGKLAGSQLTTEKGNTFIGYQTGWQTKKTAPKEGDQNTFIGYSAGSGNTKGKRNVFIGEGSGTANTTADGNTFIGRSAGGVNTTGAGNVFIGLSTGGGNTTAGDNTFIGSLAGLSNTTGEDNVFIGKEAGEDNTTGDDNIFIGNEAGEHNKGGINKTGSRQLNIGNLIFGKMPSSPPGSTIKFLSGQPTTSKYLKEIVKTNDPTLPDSGLVINGNLYVRGRAFANCKHNGTCGPWSTSLGTPSSSKIHKKNITPFVEFEKSLTDITTTPLFTYEYKEDHPDHQRMGIIAEDLPPHLQIKDQYEPVKPDWVSIYGTFWASIKALFNKVTNLTKSILRLNSITSSLKVNLYEVKEKLEDLHGVKDRLEVLEKETQFLRKQNKELKKDNKELKRQIKTLNKKMKVSQ